MDLSARVDPLTPYSNLALVLSGGGARAAYQVGFLRLLARECPSVVPGILTGVSAGGINAAYLAAQQGAFALKVEQLAKAWAAIRIDDVFRVDLQDLASRTLRWGGRLLGGGTHPLRPARSMVDTAPLRGLLARLLEADGTEIPGIAQSLDAGSLRAIALTAGKFLMPKVLKAQTYAVMTNDRTLFHDSLVEVVQTSMTIWPEQRLANELARVRANRYLAHESDLF